VTLTCPPEAQPDSTLDRGTTIIAIRAKKLEELSKVSFICSTLATNGSRIQ
jgi:hypothetical protein